MGAKMGWFKRGLPPHQTALAMIGARAGDRVLFVGAGAPALAAEVARVTGLTGRTLVLDSADGARARVDRAAADAGTLVEFEDASPTMLPIDADAFDITVIVGGRGSADAIHRTTFEACRVLRPGGRIVITWPIGRGGLFSGASPAPPLVDILQEAGAIAARHLADADGVAYYEGRKGRDVTAGT
jgi:SAM-dependent methyltransferase